MFGLVLKYIKPYRSMFVLGSAAKLIEAILELFLPILMANIIDIGMKEGNQSYIIKTGSIMFVLIFLGLSFAIYCQYTASVTSQGTGANIRRALLKKISSFSYAELDKLGTETLINRITSDVNYVIQAIALTMRLITRAPFLCIGAVIMALSIDVQLTIIFAVIIPILGAILYFFMKTTSPLYSKAQKKLDTAALVIRENLSGVRVIRAFSGINEEEKRFNTAAAELKDSNTHAANMSALMRPSTSIIVNFAIIAILYFGALRVYSGHLTQGSILALSTYATIILYSLIIVANIVVLFTKASASSERINQVLGTAPSVVFPSHTTQNTSNDIDTAFEFNNVSFSYSHNSDNTLSNISLKVKKGTTLGIIGVTGSGKTTLINLLQRFYDTTDGEIKIDGINVKDFSKDELRQKIGVVPQNTVLFSDSIAENVKWGKEDATDNEVLNALKTAQALDFVQALPDGIKTLVQAEGKNFSGGQRQRLAIARAVVKQPPILIMDDSLSALDYKTDLMLRKALKEQPNKTTAVIVSQRISSVINADNIIVLNDGKITGEGRHSDLLKNCAEYRELYETQSQIDGKPDVTGGADNGK